MRASLAVSVVDGEVEIRDIQGPVAVVTVEGEVRIQNVRGVVAAKSFDDDVILRGIRGDQVAAESIGGDVLMDDIESPDVAGSTVDGEVRFVGPLLEGGEYTLVTHDGDLTVRLSDRVNADVSISTFEGKFRSDFPVQVSRFRGGREFSFTLGEGGAKLVLRAFDGDIRLEKR